MGIYINITSIATIFILLSGGEGEIVGPISSWETVGVILVILFNALLPSLLLFPIALTLDKLTKNRPVWLKIVLPFPFILAAALLTLPIFIYFYIEIPEALYTFWLSPIDELVILLVILVVTFALFVPYWYTFQLQRFVAWSVRDIEL